MAASTKSSLLALSIFVTAVLACSTGNGIVPESGTPVTAKDIIGSYKSNEVSADSLYKNRSLLVTGLVDTIGKDLLDRPYVTLNAGERISFPSVQCMGSRNSTEFASLRKGQEIKVIGICKGKLGNILLDPCRIGGNETTQSAPPVTVTATPTPTSHDRLIWAKNSISGKDFHEAERQISQIPSSAVEYKEAQNLLPVIKQGVAAQKRAMAPRLREQLAAEYRQLVADANPHLNFVESRITKIKGGYALWATHDFFSQYSLSSGDDAKVIQEWIYRNEQRLEDSEVVRVGLMGRGPYSSWVYFNVK